LGIFFSPSKHGKQYKQYKQCNANQIKSKQYRQYFRVSILLVVKFHEKLINDKTERL